MKKLTGKQVENEAGTEARRQKESESWCRWIEEVDSERSESKGW